MKLMNKRIISFLLALVMILGMMPMTAFAAEETGSGNNALAGKTISILGASISTYTGISNNPDYNSTIGNNAVYYTEGKLGVYKNDTWWMQVANDLGLELLVNNSWSGSSLLYERNGTVGAYVDRCVQLHNNDGEEPDIIGIQMGTNDFQYYKDTLGTADIDYAALITENEDGSYTYAEPTTSLEAAAIVLHKISIRYPDAEVYYLNISQRIDGTDELIRSFNAELKQVVEHFGAHIVDIYGSAITMADFDTYIGDGRVHPNCLGMDAYTEAFKRALLANTVYEVNTHTVSLDLNGVTADYGDDKIVVSGDAFSCKLTAEDGKELSVSVTMGGADITDTTYENGTISIESVTDDVVITSEATVHKPQNYRWEFDGTDLACVSGGNTLTKDSGTTTDGVFSKTSYTLKNEVVLMHDLPWAVEWKCEGTFLNTNGSSGARIFTSDNVNANYNARYIFKSNTNGIVAMGEKTSSGSHNYGIALGDYDIDWTALHTYRLENRIADDGSNMIYLLVDGEEIGPMNHYYIGTKDQNTTSDWLSGKDFVFPYMGTDTHGFTNASIDYIQVWEIAHTHTYTSLVTAPTCTEQGYTTYTCECGDSYVDNYVDAKGHKRTNGICTVCGDSFAGKKVSILSHSMSTYAGVSNNTASNSTIGSNDVYYTEGRLSVYQKDTWWQQVIDALDMELLVNNSWSGSCVFMPRKGEASVGYGDRAVNLHNDHTGEEPDIIFVYLGCNDFAYYKDTFGEAADVNYATLITDNGDGTFTYAVPATTCEAYAIMLHKVTNRYPDADIYCMTSTARRETDYTGDSYPDAGQPTAYSAELQKVAQYFGFPVIDLENAIPKEVELFDKYIGDKRAHANALGMDQITNEVLSVMLGSDAEICHVTSKDGTVAEQAVLLGGSYCTDVELQEGYSVVVTMDGDDITAEVYNNGKISIEEVTGDIAIIATRNPLNFRWEFQNGILTSVGSSANVLTKLSGTVANNILNDGIFQLDTPVVLKHDLPWAVEWKCAEDWRGAVLVTHKESATKGMTFLTRTKGGQLCFGTYTGSQYDNYGIDISGLNANTHTYLLENRIAADGSNMIWLYVDGAEVGPMNNYFIGSKDQNKTSNWISGKDFVFSFIGMTGHALRNCQLDYLSVTECVHTYENGICTGCGETQPGPVITQQPVNGEAKLGERYCVTVEAEGEGLTYQWYLRNAGSKNFSKSSVKDNTYDDVMTEARAGREVYCVITDTNGNSVTTEIVKLVLLPSEELAIVTQPTDGEAALGERYCVTVEAKGEGLKYQWYFRNKGATRWTKSSVTDNTYDDVMNNTRNGREVYCVITDKFGNSVTTNIVKLVRVPMKLEIISQPTDATAAFGETFCATAVAKGEGLKYQWYYRNAGSTKWYKSGVRDNTYDDVMTKVRAGREVYCVITDKYGNSVTTDIVKLIAVPSVELKLLGVTYEAAAMGERYCVTLDVQGEGLTYTWYFRNAGATRWSKSGVRDNTYDDVMNKTRANREVYCVITDACGNQITTEVITLTVEK